MTAEGFGDGEPLRILEVVAEQAGRRFRLKRTDSKQRPGQTFEQRKTCSEQSRASSVGNRLQERQNTFPMSWVQTVNIVNEKHGAGVFISQTLSHGSRFVWSWPFIGIPRRKERMCIRKFVHLRSSNTTFVGDELFGKSVQQHGLSDAR